MAPIRILLLLALCWNATGMAIAQDFTPVDYGIKHGHSAKWVDIDNDDDLDLIVHPYLYVNTGTGFTEIILDGGGQANYIEIIDIDNDFDMDFIVTGSWLTRIYVNEGSLTFSYTNMENRVNGPVACGDLNNDGLEDFICTGEYDGDVFLYMYHNEGNGYTEIDHNLSGCMEGTVRIFDFDKDQRNDILIAGVDINGNPVNYLYINQGNFEFIKQETFDPCRYESSLNIADFDNNGWMDFSISGYSGTWLQKQSSANTFSKESYNFTWNREGTSAAFNYDGDEDIDLFVSGFYPPLTTYYTRENNDTYSVTSETNFSAYRGALAIGDYDNDSDLDYYLAGNDGTNEYSMVHRNNYDQDNTPPSVPLGVDLYTDGMDVYFAWPRSTDDQTPSEAITYNVRIYQLGGGGGWYGVAPHANLTNGYLKSIEPGNAGNDTLFMISRMKGVNDNWDALRISVQAIDNCNNASEFTEENIWEIGPLFQNITYDVSDAPCHIGKIELFDYDNDHDLDIIAMGYNHYNDGTWKDSSMIFMFENTGGTFPDFDENNLYQLFSQRNIVDFALHDFNNDNQVDIFVGGDTSRLLINNGQKGFEEALDYPASNYYQTTAADISNDGFTDILLGSDWRKHNGNRENPVLEINPGINVPGGYITSVFDYNNDGLADCFSSGNLYKNLGNTFQLVLSLDNLSGGTCHPADIDNDNDLDFIYTGWLGEIRYLDIYINNGNDSFSLFDQNQLRKVKGVGFPGDFDNNGSLDLFVGGYSSSILSRLYLHDGKMGFEELSFDFDPTFDRNKAAFGDINNDGDLDIVLMPSNIGYNIYENRIAYQNAKPGPPENLNSEKKGFGIILNWDPASDDHTPVQSLTYNIRIGSTPGGTDIISPMADSDGYRFVVGMGNTWLNTSWQLDSLPVGTYYWSVQAIDDAYIGGEWAAEESFDINVLTADFLADTVCEGSITSFADNTYTSGEAITDWYWDFQDGTISSEQNVQHVFPSYGTYDVKLIVTSASSIDSITKPVVVKARPETDFSADIACQGIATNLLNETKLNGTSIDSWFWYFDDGNTSELENPGTHGFLIAGNYNVKLRAVASNGCIDSVINIVRVGANPTAIVSASSQPNLCMGDSVVLTVPYNADYLYSWRADGILLTNADSSSFIARQTGNYSAEVTNPIGSCTSTSSAVSVVFTAAPAAPLISVNGSLEFCEGSSVLLSVTDNPDYSYQWKLNGGAVGDNSNSFQAENPGTYTLAVGNTNGCEVNSVNSIDVIVNESPQIPVLSLSGPAEFCEGEVLVLSVQEDPVYSYQWSAEYGNLTGETTGSYSANESGTYSLIVSNQSGCNVETPPVVVDVKAMPVKPLLMTDNYSPGDCMGLEQVRIYTDEIVEYDYQWLKNGMPVTGETASYLEGYLQEGDYTLQADMDGCIIESDAVNLDFENAPKKPDLYVHGPVVWYLAASTDSASHYRWFLNKELIQGADEYIYVANQTTGIYSVAVANEFGCYTISDEVSIPVGKSEMSDFYIPQEYRIENIDPFANLKIYPNPTPGLFTVEMDNHILGDLDIKIFTNEGRQVLIIKFHKTNNHFRSQIDLSGQGEGIYLINFLLDTYAASRKIILELNGSQD